MSYICFVLIAFLYLICAVCADTVEDEPLHGPLDQVQMGAMLVGIALPYLRNNCQKVKKYKGRVIGSKTVARERRAAEYLFTEMSDHGFRRMYRMS